jgi:small subunit ribosomal protein S12
VATHNQISKKPRLKRIKKTKHLLLQNRPQKKVSCLNQLEMAPRKPNSAKRNIADVFWFQKPK